MGLCQYVDLCFHASSLPCLHIFRHYPCIFIRFLMCFFLLFQYFFCINLSYSYLRLRRVFFQVYEWPQPQNLKQHWEQWRNYHWGRLGSRPTTFQWVKIKLTIEWPTTASNFSTHYESSRVSVPYYRGSGVPAVASPTLCLQAKARVLSVQMHAGIKWK